MNDFVKNIVKKVKLGKVKDYHDDKIQVEQGKVMQFVGHDEIIALTEVLNVKIEDHKLDFLKVFYLSDKLELNVLDNEFLENKEVHVAYI